MALILGLDSSTLTLSVALADKEGTQPPRLLEAVEAGPPKKQSELMPGLVMDLLARRGLTLRELSGIALGIGPGSFTGLRIGVSAVKAFAYAAGLPVGKVSSLAALAWDGPPGVPLAPCASARTGELYVGHYLREADGLRTLDPEEALEVEAFARWLCADPQARAFGPGLEREGAKLAALGVPAHQFLPGPGHPRALAVIALAAIPATSELSQLFALEPHYLRASEPERNPKFPPLPGPEPRPRLKDDEDDGKDDPSRRGGRHRSGGP